MQTIKATTNVTSVAAWNAITSVDMISLDELNCAGIVSVLKHFGITQVREAAYLIKIDDDGYIKGDDGTIYEYPFATHTTSDGQVLGTSFVANTNADPIWQDSDEGAFAELLAEYFIRL